MEEEQPEEQLQRLLNEARAGSQAAAQELYDKFAEPLLFVVRHRLSPEARRLLDSSDLTQEVWKDFFAKALREKFFSTPQDLVAFLCGMAVKKVAMAERRLF